jgi:hypothetical protein
MPLTESASSASRASKAESVQRSEQERTNLKAIFAIARVVSVAVATAFAALFYFNPGILSFAAAAIAVTAGLDGYTICSNVLGTLERNRDPSLESASRDTLIAQYFIHLIRGNSHGQ